MTDPARRDPLGDVAALALLDDPRRRRLYDFVAGRSRPVGRDEAAAATALGRPLAAYHLDKLARGGLLDVVFARPEGRGGPGAGRPAKQYVRPQRALAAQAPARDYLFVARLLAAAADGAGPRLRRAVAAAARAEGLRAGAAIRSAGEDVEAALAARGYEPQTDERGTLTLRNCPFHAVASAYPELVCGLNRAFVEGLLEGVGAADRTASFEPCDGRCCVTIGPATARG